MAVKNRIEDKKEDVRVNAAHARSMAGDSLDGGDEYDYYDEDRDEFYDEEEDDG